MEDLKVETEFLDIKLEAKTLELDTNINLKSEIDYCGIDYKLKECLDVELKSEAADDDNKPRQDLEYQIILPKANLSQSESKQFVTLEKTEPKIKGYRFSCLTCDHKTKDKKSMVKHQIIHKSLDEITHYKCGQCDFTSKFKHSIKGHIISIHKSEVDTEIYKCDLCEYQTKRKLYIKRHKKIHQNKDEATMYKCVSCDYETQFNTNLRRHILQNHRSEDECKVFQCHFCGFKSKLRYRITSHIKDVHYKQSKEAGDSSNFSCQVCNYVAKNQSNLSFHIKTHLDAKNTTIFKCDLCDFHTKHQKNVKRHKFTHQNTDNLETIECNIVGCLYKTKRQDSYKKHMLVHKKLLNLQTT